MERAKKFARKGHGGLIFCIIWGIVIILLFAMLTAFSFVAMTDADHWNDADANEYQYIDVQMMSDVFATDSDNNVYVFAAEVDGDGMRSNYVVCLREKDYDDFTDMVEYTYGETDQLPKAVRLYGYAYEDSQDLIDIATENLKIYWDDDSITSDDLYAYFDFYYLDCSKGYTIQYPWFMLGLLAFGLVVGGLIIFFAARKVVALNKVSNATIERLRNDPTMLAALEQMNSPETQYIKKAQTYLCGDYIVCCQKGFEMVDIRQINHIYGVDHNSTAAWFWFGWIGSLIAGPGGHALVLITDDNMAHEVANLGRVKQYHNNIVNYILTRKNNILLGRNAIAPGVTGVDVSRMQGFYGSDEPWKGRTM